MKKGIYIIVLFASIGLSGFAQSSYMVSTNRLLMSTLVNNDTIVIENNKNKVRINGDMGLLEIEYHHRDSRMVNQKTNEVIPTAKDFTITFYNDYLWLEDRIKSSENESSFTDALNVEILDETLEIPVNIKFNRMRGMGNVFSVLMEISGVLSPRPLEEKYPELNFHNDIPFKIILTINVTN